MIKNGVFISWSGERSRRIAEELCSWLKCVVQMTKPFVSTKDIDKGSFWFNSINDALSNAAIGIFCITKENKNKPWILFEAGAVSKGLTRNRVCTLLIDLKPNDIHGPLQGFNHTDLNDRDSFWGLIKTINANLDDKIQEETLLDVFNVYYPRFKKKCESIKNETIANVDEGNLSEQIDALKQTVINSSNQLKDIGTALAIYYNLRDQGVHNVFKCNSEEYTMECERLRSKIQAATEIRAIFHIGKEFLEKYKDDIIAAIKNKGCSVKLLIIDKKFAGSGAELLSCLCPDTKQDEVNHWDVSEKIVNEIKIAVNNESDINGSIEIRPYSFAPTGSILIVDEIVRFIPYLPKRQSGTSVAIFGKKNVEGKGIFNEFETVFNRIWTAAERNRIG